MASDSGHLTAGMEGSLAGTDASHAKDLKRRLAAPTCLLVLVVLLQVGILAVLLMSNSTRSTELDKVTEELASLASMYRWPRSNQSEPQLNYECLYAAGGGTVGSTGDLPETGAHLQSLPNGDEDRCKAVFDWYFANGQGQYWADLAKIGNAAINYYTAKETFKKDGSDMLVFDIDETVLSNLQADRLRRYGHQAHHALQTPAGNASRRLLGSAPGQTPASADASDFAPALDAIKDVYTAAYSYGLSVAFITGRSEGGRDFTQRNLKSEGFGDKCAHDSKGKALRSKDAPCYVDLHMRNMQGDQNTLASVYKPQRRQQLRDQGYRLVGAFGDQFSDLEGEHSALASWKLPNPLYYIL